VKIWINRAGQNLGTLDSEEVQRGLDSGRYLTADLGWREGMKNWKPLSEFPELRLPRAQVPAVQLPVSGAPQAAPQQPTGDGSSRDLSDRGCDDRLARRAYASVLAGPILVGVPLSIGLNFVLAGVFHFCLMLMKGKSKAFEATYRVTSYCSSAYVFGVMPFFGLYVSWIWGLICMAVGLQKVHKTEGWRATIAVLIPVVAYCGFVLVLLGFVFFLIGFHSRAS
jgi:Yip1 domain/GYF domain 2